MSFGCSLIRRPGMRKERGTQVGASRRMPWPASRAERTAAALAGGVEVVVIGSILRGGVIVGREAGDARSVLVPAATPRKEKTRSRLRLNATATDLETSPPA